MAGNFHIHRSRMDFAQASAVRADCPDAIHLVPRSLVAKQEKRRIGRRELYVVQPICAVVEGTELPGLDIDCIERHRNARGQPSLHHFALTGWVIAVLLGLCLWRGPGWLRPPVIGQASAPPPFGPALPPTPAPSQPS